MPSGSPLTQTLGFTIRGAMEELLFYSWMTFVSVVLLCPSVLRLVWLAMELRKGAKYQRGRDFTFGVFFHVFGATLSPGMPAYLFYEQYKCGPGCASGVFLIVLMPAAWIVFVVSEYSMRQAKCLAPPESSKKLEP
jgi:hypothetical protein